MQRGKYYHDVCVFLLSINLCLTPKSKHIIIFPKTLVRVFLWDQIQENKSCSISLLRRASHGYAVLEAILEFYRAL